VSERVREWLPLEAVSSDGIRRKIDEVSSAWSARWLGDESAVVASVSATPSPRRDDNDGLWSIHRAAVATRFSRSMTARLVERALGVRFEGLALTDADRRLVAAFSRKMAEDLAVSLEVMLGLEGALLAQPLTVPDPWGPLGGVTITLSNIRDTLLTVAIPREAIVGLCKAGLQRASTPRLRPAGRTEAIGPTSVRVEAVVGRARLTLAELRELAAGDIIVLDNDLGSGVELAAPGVDAALARASLGETQGRVTLTLQARTH
jgi:hypothetical protein